MFSILGMEATQAIQYFASQFPVCGNDLHRIRCGDNSVPLVAGKATVIRVYITGHAPTDRITGFGSTILPWVTGAVYYYPANAPLVNLPATPSRANALHSLNIVIPPQESVGNRNITITVYEEVQGMAAGVATATIGLNFVPRNLVQMRLLRMHYKGRGLDIAAPTLAEFWQNADVLQHRYPVALPGIELVRESEEIFDGDFTTRWDSDDPAEIGTTGTMWDIMFRLQATEGLNPDTVYCALYPDAAGANGGGAAGKFCVTPMGYSDYMAHEVGHTCGLPHAPSVTAVAAGYTDPNYPQYGMQPGGSIGEVGFDPRTFTAFDPNSTYDLMAYDGPQWISPYNYQRLFDCVGPPPPQLPLLMPPEMPEFFSCYWLENMPGGDLLRKVCGPGISTAVPLWPRPKVPGLAFEARLLRDDGSVLVTGAFRGEPFFPSPPEGPLQLLRITLPWHSEARRMELLREGKVVETREVSPHVPRLSGKVGEIDGVSGTLRVSWETEGAPGISVRASSDRGRTWTAFNVASRARQVDVNASFLPPGESCMVEVLATSGMRTARWRSDVIRMKTGREDLLMLAPAKSIERGAGEPVELCATMWDGRRSKSILWSSDRDGELGKGAHLVLTNLSPGKHQISARWGPSGAVVEAPTVVIERRMDPFADRR